MQSNQPPVLDLSDVNNDFKYSKETLLSYRNCKLALKRPVNLPDVKEMIERIKNETSKAEKKKSQVVKKKEDKLLDSDELPTATEIIEKLKAYQQKIDQHKFKKFKNNQAYGQLLKYR